MLVLTITGQRNDGHQQAWDEGHRAADVDYDAEDLVQQRGLGLRIWPALVTMQRHAERQAEQAARTGRRQTP